MTRLQFGRYRVEISNENKIFYPDKKISKGDIIGYYRRISGVMLPHLKERPLMLQRFPDGITGSGFYQKNIGDYFPKWIQRAKLAKRDGTVVHPLCNNTASLVYLADQASVTFHSWLSRAAKPNQPDRMIFDLDPGDDDFSQVRKAAQRLGDLLKYLQLKPFVMTTGSRGLHVVVPLKIKEEFDHVRETAREIAGKMVESFPEEYTLEQLIDKRKGKLFLDTNRNAYAQTGVVPYSLRPKPGAPVATPLNWHELQSDSLNGGSYTLKNIFRRLGALQEEPWKKMRRHQQLLDKARKVLR